MEQYGAAAGGSTLPCLSIAVKAFCSLRCWQQTLAARAVFFSVSAYGHKYNPVVFLNRSVWEGQLRKIAKTWGNYFDGCDCVIVKGK